MSAKPKTPSDAQDRQVRDPGISMSRRRLVGGVSSLGLAAVAGMTITPGTSAAAFSQHRHLVYAAMRQPAETSYQTWNLAEYEQETGETISEFTEAPSLAERVDAGELPAVLQRMPEQPLVVQPIQEIGTYCGPLTGYGVNPTSFGNDVVSARRQFLIGIYPDLTTFAPQIAESYELSDDATTFTVRLRQGMRWSDGEPATAADILFWYEDIVLNEEITPAIESNLQPGGEVIQVTQEDDYTVVFTSSVPYPVIIEYLATNAVFVPRHYLEQWHIDYNPEVESIAEAEGFDTWVQLFQSRNAIADDQVNPDRPVLDPWAFTRTDDLGNKYYERNPYYWKVDTQGQQLPYAESEVRVLTGNIETTILQIRNGDIDFGAEQIQLQHIAVLREGEEAGNYRALLWQGVTGAERRYQLNLTVQDPVLREIFNDVRFRQALSLGINRDEINETLFFGQATPRQFTVPPSVTLYEDWMGEHFVELDVEGANQLLDEMGLERRESDGLRLRPDGEPLQFTIEDSTFNEAMDELIVEYWLELGIDAQIRSITRELYAERALANELQASVWFGDIVDEVNIRLRPVSFRPPWGIDTVPHSGALWHRWYTTDGAEGEEPPEEIRSLYELADEFQQTIRDTPEFEEVGTALLTQNLEGLYVIGTVGLAPAVVVAANNLRNFPEDSVMMLKMQPAHGDQWYLAE